MANQPRTSMDPGKLQSLAQTFETQGFKGAIIIWYPKPDHPEIISGHRSHQAFLQVARKYSFAPPWDRIPCSVFTDLTPGRAYELAILYNEKREDLTLLELAQSWRRLASEYNYTTKQIATSFSTSHSTVCNTLAILNEPPYILAGVESGALTLADVLQLKRLPDGPAKRKLAQMVISGQLAKSRIKLHVESALREQPKKSRTYDINMFDNVDVIMCSDTGARPPFCCIATHLKYLVGFRTTSGGHRIRQKCKNHPVHFLDNDYKNCPHDLHMEVIREYKPKYTTIRDYMSREDCERENISYYTLDQVLDWGHEAQKYAENVIIITKVPGTVEQIPQSFILGYPTSTSYGFSPIPFEDHKSHRIHLLGGSPMRQYAFYKQAQEQVVSCDSNYIHKIAMRMRILGNFAIDIQGIDQAYLAFYHANLLIQRDYLRGKINDRMVQKRRAKKPSEPIPE